MPDVDPLTTDDLNLLLHELRGRELARTWPDAQTVLSGGCAGGGYFDWFAQRYPGHPSRHIGVEARSPRPDDLPAGVEWLARTLGDLGPVQGGSVDLVFAGQTIERIWPEEIAGFLCEAHRVLRSDGRLVLDGPNRIVTEAAGSVRPEHTLELSVAEARELLALAGFTEIEVRGLWLCYDRETHEALPWDRLDADRGLRERRIEEAAERPEDAIAWWIEARRGTGAPRGAELSERVNALGDRFRALTLSRLRTVIGRPGRSERGEPMVVADGGTSGVLLDGPDARMRPGAWEAVLMVGGPPTPERASLDPALEVAHVEVVAGHDARELIGRTLRLDELPASGDLVPITLPFRLSASTTSGLRARVVATGGAALRARMRVELLPGADGLPPASTGTALERPGLRLPRSPDDPLLEGWYHTIELGDGLVTKGHFDHRTVRDRYGLPASLRGKSALDVGTADGFFAFELERRGADPVVTLDVACLRDCDWVPRVLPHVPLEILESRSWGEHFAIAHAMLGSRVHREELSVYDLSPERLGTFDVVFSGDLLLHLQHPLGALINIRSVTREMAVIESVRDPFLESAHAGEPYVRFGVIEEESEPGRNTTYWRLTTRALMDMLLYAGFSRVEPQPLFGLPPYDLPAAAVVAYV